MARHSARVPRNPSVLVLCYHAIADLSTDPILAEYGISKEEFAVQLDDLQARGFTFVTPDDLAEVLEGKGEIHRRAVLLTFDDCYEELEDVARSILKPNGIKAIAFAVTGMGSGTNEWDQKIGARPLRLLDKDGLLELERHGVEIGCHSRSHQSLRSSDDSRLAAELAGAADDIADMGLRRPRYFAYPHAVHDQRARSAARAVPFFAAFGGRPGRTTRNSDRYALPRVMILARDTGWRFHLKTSAPVLSPITSGSAVFRRYWRRLTRPLRRFSRRRISSSLKKCTEATAIPPGER